MILNEKEVHRLRTKKCEGGKSFWEKKNKKVCSLSLESFVQEHTISPLRIIVI